MKKTFIGAVVSTKMDKTVTVRVERKFRHPLYKKVVKRFKKFKVHCEQSGIKEGSFVRIEEMRPMSKDKNFRVLEVIE
jgi:small subunit ribosomal protein S17